MLFLGLFVLAACSTDSADTAADGAADGEGDAPVAEAEANPCDAGANPCDGMAEAEANPCDAAANPCDGMAEAPTGRAPSAEVSEAIAAFLEHDPDMQSWFDGSAGFVVFPGIGKGALVVGGAHGNGELVVGGFAVGKAELAELSIGAQAGGQDFREIIFFESAADVAKFEAGGWEIGGGASAVAVTTGAGARARYDTGVAVFTLPKAGLMAEISVGGQKFKYEAY